MRRLEEERWQQLSEELEKQGVMIGEFRDVWSVGGCLSIEDEEDLAPGKPLTLLTVSQIRRLSKRPQRR